MYPSGQEAKLIQDPSNLGGGSFWVYEKLNNGGYMYYNEGGKSWNDFQPNRYSETLFKLGSTMTNTVAWGGAALITGGAALEVGLGGTLLKETAIEVGGELLVNRSTKETDVADIGIATVAGAIPSWRAMSSVTSCT